MKAVLASMLIVGCGTTPSGFGPVDYGEGLGDPENPVPQQSSEGPYAVANRIDFTVEAILPAQLAFAVETLRAFSENPASALFDLAEAKGVPAVGLIRAALPGVLEDKLEGWINDFLDKPKIAGKTLREYAGEMADLAELALTQFQIDSEMTIDGYDVTHTFVALDLSPTGIIDVRIPIGGLAADILTQHPTITVAEGGAIAFGDQHLDSSTANTRGKDCRPHRKRCSAATFAPCSATRSTARASRIRSPTSASSARASVTRASCARSAPAVSMPSSTSRTTASRRIASTRSSSRAAPRASSTTMAMASVIASSTASGTRR
jgi:hypothetical protein